MKKVISLFMAVLMLISMLTVSFGAVTVSTAATGEDEITLESNKLYFDTDGTGWTMGTKNKVAFHIFGGDIENGIAWGGKKSIGAATAGADGIFEIDPQGGKQGYTLNPGVQYKIIFVRTDGNNWTDQTYDLLFTTDCLGHIAYCDGTQYENPVDSSKTATAAFWRDMDASQYGPVLQISSIGNVVGTCPEEGKTPESIFTDFLTVVDSTTNVTTYQNAYHYVVESGNKTDQKLIDDIGEGLGLTKQQVYDAFTTNNVETTWDYTVSSLPGDVVLPTEPHTHTPAEPVQENVVPASCTAEGSYDEVVYCSECGEELSREQKTIDKIAHTPGEPVLENEVVGHDSTTYDSVVYCTVCGEEISRTPVSAPIITHTLDFVDEVPATEEAEGVKAHYECHICGKLFSDAAGKVEVTKADLVIPKLTHTHTPGEAVRENEVPATCKAAGSYDMVVYCTACGEELSREHHEIGKLLHTPGEAVRENEVPASCTEEGSYDEVVYCTVCGEELSRETKTIDKTAHTLKFRPTKKATETADGYKSHFECTECGKYFADATGTVEVTWEQIVIHYVAPTDPPATEPDPTDPPATEPPATEPKIEGALGDADNSGEVDIVDVTFIQRALAKSVAPSEEVKVRGDVDKNGALESIDATLIQRWLLGLEQNRGIGSKL